MPFLSPDEIDAIMEKLAEAEEERYEQEQMASEETGEETGAEEAMSEYGEEVISMLEGLLNEGGEE